MIDLKDFFHLPEVDVLLAQVVNDARGITVVAGLGARSAQASSAGLPEALMTQSDRSTIAAIVMRHTLDRAFDGKKIQATVVGSDRNALRVANHQRRQVEFIPAPLDHIDRFTTGLQQAMMRSPDLLVIDRLNTVTARATFHAAASGRRVLTQIDTALVGGEVLQEIVSLGCSPSQMSLVSWVVAVPRVPALCAYCKQPHQPGSALLETMAERHNVDRSATFYVASGCRHCNGTGYTGELTAFDIFRVHGGVTSFSELVSTPSLLPLEGYIARLAAQGYVALEDAVRLETLSPRRLAAIALTRREAPDEATRALERKLVEIETANKMLAQRIESLISLHEFSLELAAPAPADLAARIVRYACEIGDADRAVLYLAEPSGEFRLAAVHGWDTSIVRPRVPLPASMLDRGDPESVIGAPPGIDLPATALSTIQAGLRVPLAVDDALIGVLILNRSRTARFSPGNVAILKLLGRYAAATLARGRVFDELHAQIANLQVERFESIRAAREERERELIRDYHAHLLPVRLPWPEGAQLAAAYRPAPDIGADVYDAIDLAGGRFGIVMADVAGRGWPAVKAMSAFHALIRAEAQRSESPREVLKAVHRSLSAAGGRETLFTAWYGIFDASARRLAYCRAGHTRPLWLRSDGYIVLLSAIGTPLGALDSAELDLAEAEIFFSPGDTLLLYTNGLVEAVDPHGTEFGLEHWVNRAKEHAGLPPDRLCAALFDEIVEFQAGAAQTDDMALLILRVVDL